MDFYSNKEDKLEFRQLVLQQIQKIQDILSKELKLYETFITPKIGVNVDSYQQKEDTRESFIQSVETLAYLLYPYFDEQMSKVYKPFENAVDSYWFEFYDNNKKYVDNILEEIGATQEEGEYPVETIKAVFILS